MSNRALIVSAFAAAVAAPSLLLAQGGPIQGPTPKMERCYGIAKAGQNDCSSAGNNSCAGMSKIDADPKAWLNLPEGRCERIVGASKAPKA